MGPLSVQKPQGGDAARPGGSGAQAQPLIFPLTGEARWKCSCGGLNQEKAPGQVAGVQEPPAPWKLGDRADAARQGRGTPLPGTSRRLGGPEPECLVQSCCLSTGLVRGPSRRLSSPNSQRPPHSRWTPRSRDGRLSHCVHNSGAAHGPLPRAGRCSPTLGAHVCSQQVQEGRRGPGGCRAGVRPVLPPRWLSPLPPAE